MAGSGREFMGKLDQLSPKDRECGYSESVRDFWKTSTRDNSSDQESGDQDMKEQGRDGDLTVASLECSKEPATESANTEPAGTHQVDFFETISASSQALSVNAYTNFFNGTCIRDDAKQLSAAASFVTTHGGEKHSPTPDSQPPGNSSSEKFLSQGLTTGFMPAESINREMETLIRRELGEKCPRSSGLLMAITSSVEDAVQDQQEFEFGPSSDDNDDEDDDDDDAVDQDQVSDHEHDRLRAAISDHPLFPEMVLAHVRILKIGAPSALLLKLNDLTKKYQRYEVGESSKLGQDSEIDYFMRSYVDLLIRLREDLEEPFNKFMQFVDSTTKALEDLCGHYVETGADEEDNYGFDIGPMDGSQDSDDLEILGEENLMHPTEETLMHPTDIDESIVVDPNASEEELKKTLMRKYGRHIGGLKAEFNRVRKKGKLPASARQILKDWFNRHSYWPYPSEMEKAYLQRLCSLNLKQINNWFINERKRHWSSEDKCMHPNTKFYDDSDTKFYDDSNAKSTGRLDQ